MSKLYFKLSYKDACILKHALRNQCENKENVIDEYYSQVEYYKKLKDWELPNNYVEIIDNLNKQEERINKEKAELEEEKAALERFIEQLNSKSIKY